MRLPRTDVRVLVIGYGNPGRRDDGLGPAAAERLAAAGLPGVSVDADYQLQIEDAAAIAGHDVIVFVDAAARGPAPLFLRRIRPRRDTSFTSHSVSPASLLAMAADHFGARVEGYACGIRGVEFEGFGEGLSPSAEAHLDAAVDFLVSALRRRRFDPAEAEAVCRAASAPST